MTPGPGFELAVALLFAIPGPTNALIGLAGPYVAATPALGLALRGLCALLLARSAWLLRRSAGASGAARGSTSAAAVLATTLVNPKALIFAFAIFPPFAGAAEAVDAFARFALLAAVAMTLWGLAGAAVLAAFSVVVLAAGFAGERALT
jgi:threonine/homoserine/homoserine lactone efflux protein